MSFNILCLLVIWIYSSVIVYTLLVSLLPFFPIIDINYMDSLININYLHKLILSVDVLVSFPKSLKNFEIVKGSYLGFQWLVKEGSSTPRMEKVTSFINCKENKK